MMTKKRFPLDSDVAVMTRSLMDDCRVPDKYTGWPEHSLFALA
jgi:hypothetical protein